MQKPTHGITFEVDGIKKHTWKDWQIVPQSRPVFSTPKVRKSQIVVPGLDGVLDVSKALTGEVQYEMRTGKFDFLVHDKSNWANKFTEICNFLHGKDVKVTFDDDPNFYYKGTAEVTDWANGDRHTTVEITVEADPFKYKNKVTQVKKTISQQGTVTCPNLRKSVIPHIISNANMNLTFDGTTASIQSGTSIVPEFRFKQGDNIVTCKGNETITFEYQEGGF